VTDSFTYIRYRTANGIEPATARTDEAASQLIENIESAGHEIVSVTEGEVADLWNQDKVARLGNTATTLYEQH
jgi:hypothetical protein